LEWEHSSIESGHSEIWVEWGYKINFSVGLSFPVIDRRIAGKVFSGWVALDSSRVPAVLECP